MYACINVFMYECIYLSPSCLLYLRLFCLYVVSVAERRSTGTWSTRSVSTYVCIFVCTYLCTYLCLSVCLISCDRNAHLRYVPACVILFTPHPIPYWTLWKNHHSDRRQVYVTISIVRQASLEHTSSWGTSTVDWIKCAWCDDVNHLEILHRPGRDMLEQYLKGCTIFSLSRSPTSIPGILSAILIAHSKQVRISVFQAKRNH